MEAGKYRFISVFNPERAIDTSSERLHKPESPLQLYQINQTMYQRFLVSPQPKHPGAFTIRSVIDAKFWGVADNADTAGAEIHFQERRDGPYQTWFFEPAGDAAPDTYRIRNAGSNCHLALSEDIPGANLVQTASADNPKALFRLLPV
jgi:hypothetical protein